VYCPFHDLLAPIWALIISAISVGRAINEVPNNISDNWENEKATRLTSVNCSSSVFKLKGIVPEGNRLERNLPVGLATNGNIVDLALVVAFIDATKDYLTRILFTASDTEGKERFLD
jgi:hypothetical protein